MKSCGSPSVALPLMRGSYGSIIILQLAVTLALIACSMTRAWPQSPERPPDNGTRVLPAAAVSVAAVFVNIAPDSAAALMTVTAGDTVRLTLTVTDETGAAITNWNAVGSVVMVAARNSTARTDTSNKSWNADALGFSWMKLLDETNREFTFVSASTWQVPASAFVDGVARVSFIDTKAEDNVYLVAWTDGGASSRSSGRISFLPGVLASLFVDLTLQTPYYDPAQVYVQRPFELIVTPRDRYLNQVDTTLDVIFTARYPNEFDTTQADYLAGFRLGTRLVRSKDLFLIPTVPRIRGYDQEQIVGCRVVDADGIQGWSPSMEVLRHKPNPFPLISPFPGTIYTHDGSAGKSMEFAWLKATPPDPYTDIQVSRYSPVLRSDEVLYTVVIADSPVVRRQVRIVSDDSGKAVVCTLPIEDLFAIMDAIYGAPMLRSAVLSWWVEAADGLFITRSTPPNLDPGGLPGWWIYLRRTGTSAADRMASPATVSLRVYPNPIDAGRGTPAAIEVVSPSASSIMVTVSDIMGREVARLMDGMTESSVSTYALPTAGLSAGTYVCTLHVRAMDGTVSVHRRAFVVSR